MINVVDYSYWLALGAVFLQCVTAYLFVEHFFLTKKVFAPYIARFGLGIVFLVGALSAMFSLTYSEVFGFIPCGLCWIQRGFLYSLTIFFSLALWRNRNGIRDTAIADYGIGLSLVAAVVALYHHVGQMTGSGLVCPTAGAGADCARRLVFEFGYMTFPLMSFTTFVFFIAVLLIYRRWHTNEVDNEDVFLVSSSILEV